MSMTLWSLPFIVVVSGLLLAGSWVWLDDWRDKRSARRCDKWAADWPKPLRVIKGERK